MAHRSGIVKENSIHLEMYFKTHINAPVKALKSTSKNFHGSEFLSRFIFIVSRRQKIIVPLYKTKFKKHSNSLNDQNLTG
jgi:hypothetical protein